MTAADLRDRPRLAPSSEPSFVPPRIEVFLVGGCQLQRDFDTWLLAGPGGCAVSRVEDAVLFSFSVAGYAAARAASEELALAVGCGRTSFVARVVVTGDPQRPDEVIEAWRIEGNQPVDLGRYPFET